MHILQCKGRIMAKLIKLIRCALFLATFGLVAQAQASLVYNTWTSNDSATGNFILTVDHIGNQFSYNLTISPWNAEALGLFLDLGNVAVGNSVGLTGVTPNGQVTLVGKDTASNSCGAGCNLNGLNLPALAGNDWELVFRLGNAGFDGIQTFSWMTNDFGLNLSAFGLVGVRAQQLCSGDDTLPADSRACGGSDKSYGYASIPTQSNQVPEPGALLLLSLAMLSVLVVQAKRNR
jgi:hypothetical protein